MLISHFRLTFFLCIPLEFGGLKWNEKHGRKKEKQRKRRSGEVFRGIDIGMHRQKKRIDIGVEIVEKRPRMSTRSPASSFSSLFIAVPLHPLSLAGFEEKDGHLREQEHRRVERC
jgi:hypothetical protein